MREFVYSRCNQLFKRKSNNQKSCKTCAKIIERERSRVYTKNRKKNTINSEPYARGGNEEWKALKNFPVESEHKKSEIDNYRFFVNAINYDEMAVRYGC